MRGMHIRDYWKYIASRRDEVFQQNGSHFLYEDLFTGRKFPKSKYPNRKREHYHGFHPDTEDEEIFTC